MVSALALALLIGVFGGLFVVQVATRLRLVRRAVIRLRLQRRLLHLLPTLKRWDASCL